MAERDARGRFRGRATPPRDGGARLVLGERFIAALAEDFARHGAAVIGTLRADRPADYLKLVLALQPKEGRAADTLEDLSNDELDRRIERLARALGLGLGEGRAREAAGREEA